MNLESTSASMEERKVEAMIKDSLKKSTGASKVIFRIAFGIWRMITELVGYTKE